MKKLADQLAAMWRADAAILRRRGAASQADAAETYAADLETAVREYELTALSLEQAAVESDYSYSALQKMVATGRLENVGTKGSPRVRRGDLPKKVTAPKERSIADMALLERVAA